MNKSNLKGRWKRKPSQVPQSSQTSVSSNAIPESEDSPPKTPEFVPTYSTNGESDKNPNHELLNPSDGPQSGESQGGAGESRPSHYEKRTYAQRGGDRKPYAGRSRSSDDNRGRFQREDNRRDGGNRFNRDDSRRDGCARRREFSPSRSESNVEKFPEAIKQEAPKCFCGKIYNFFKNLFGCKDKQSCSTSHCGPESKEGREHSRPGRPPYNNRPRWKR